MNISFSIIMPTYNRKLCIKKAVDSLLAQTYKNFELIIVDDGSEDGTEDYLVSLYKNEINNDKIKFIKLSDNKGAAFARNEGLESARYSWIGYLDTDNKMRDDFLETFADSIRKNQNYEIFYAQVEHTQSRNIIGHKFDFYELVEGNFIDLGVFIHSTKIYNELGGFNTSLNRLIDWDIIIRYTEKYKPKFIDKVLLDYYDGSKFSRITNDCDPGENFKKVIINYYKRIPPEKFINVFQTQINKFNQNSQYIATKDREIKDLKEIIKQKNNEINFMKSSKFWKLREWNNKIKFAVFSPVKFIKKHLKS